MTSRIDIIASNGNDGLHYPPTKKLVINWDEKPEWADVALEFPNSNDSDIGIWCSGKDDKWVMDDDICEVWWYKKDECPEYYIAHYPPLRCNPPISESSFIQQNKLSQETGLCSDGRPLGEHNAHFDDYCAECPNEPKLHFTPEGFATIDPLADMTVSVKPTAHADNVNHPARYQSEMGIECIMAIRAQMTCDQFAAYCQGNVVKYLWRWREKGGVESLKKAKWYLYRMIAEVEDDTTT